MTAMRYSDWLQCEPLNEVTPLENLQDTTQVNPLVSSLVLSDDFADHLIKVAFPQLTPGTGHQGLLIVGGKGTGKTHCMAVLSSLAENAHFRALLQPTQAAAHVLSWAGNFQVLRITLSKTTHSLQNLVLSRLQEYLNNLGLPTPSLENTSLLDLLQSYQNHCPQPLLLVLDDLGDCLLQKPTTNLNLELKFLRELGKACRTPSFRLLASLRKPLLDPLDLEQFSNTFRRLQEHFVSVPITQEQLKSVISQRLLKKNSTPIHNYFTPFLTDYPILQEQLPEFCALFPFHPNYIDTLTRLTQISQLHFFKTLTQTAHTQLSKKLNPHHLSLITADHCWSPLTQSPSLLDQPTLQQILEHGQILENLLPQIPNLQHYQALAKRLIHTLCLHRLTTASLDTPIGLTSTKLRDTLFPFYQPLPNSKLPLATQLQTLIEQILNQLRNDLDHFQCPWLTINPRNKHYYLDLKTTHRPEILIAKHTEHLAPEQLNLSYCQALQQLLELPEPEHSQQFIWEYELEWRTHHVTRLGFIAFGNTIPPYLSPPQFCLHYLPLIPPLTLQAHNPVLQTAELYIQPTPLPPPILHHLQHHAAASALLSTAPAALKNTYQTQVQLHLQSLIDWLNTHFLTHLQLICSPQQLTLGTWLEQQPTSQSCQSSPLNFRDTLDLLATLHLEPYFTQFAPQYPIFPILLDRELLPLLAQETLRSLPNPQRNPLLNNLLEGLGLYDPENLQLTLENSQYANMLLQQIHSKPPDQPHLTRDELLIPIGKNSYYYPYVMHLEPELLIILLVTLVYTKQAILNISERIYSADNFTQLINLPFEELLQFTHVTKIPQLTGSWQETFTLLFDLPNLSLPNWENLLQTIKNKRTLFPPAFKFLKQQSSLFGDLPIFTTAQIQHCHHQLLPTYQFLDTLLTCTQPAQLLNLNPGPVHPHLAALHTASALSNLAQFLQKLTPLTHYLTHAHILLPPNHPWLIQANTLRATLSNLISTQLSQTPPHTDFSFIEQQLQTLKNDYQTLYLKLHYQARLTQLENNEKQRLSQDQRLLNLKKLASLDCFPTTQLIAFEHSLNELIACDQLTPNSLSTQPLCPHCSFKPYQESHLVPALTKLAQLNTLLEQIHTQWEQILFNELQKLASPQWNSFIPDSPYPLSLCSTEQLLLPQVITYFIEQIQPHITPKINLPLNFNHIKKYILEQGQPTCTVPELQKYLKTYLTQLTSPHPLDKIRIFIDSC